MYFSVTLVLILAYFIDCSDAYCSSQIVRQAAFCAKEKGAEIKSMYGGADPPTDLQQVKL